MFSPLPLCYAANLYRSINSKDTTQTIKKVWWLGAAGRVGGEGVKGVRKGGDEGELRRKV